jgi:hypothetical protein
MSFTGKLGSPDSRPGNIILGLGAEPGRRFRRSDLSPLYRVQVFDFLPSTYGIGPMIAEFDRFKNLGYGKFANDVPQAFFTLHQDDPRIATLRDKGGRAHIRVLRGDTIVWTGWTSLERDSTTSDAILYAYGYLAGLYWLHTSWKQSWSGATLADIVEDAWTRASTGLTKSRLKFIPAGTIEAPATTLGGGTAITLPLYEAYYKRLLFLMQEMAAVGASDTGQSVIFEVTDSEAPAFNFWKNRRTDLTTVRWEYPSGKVRAFQEYGMPVYRRNDILAVGQQPRDLLLRTEVQDTADMDEWGRMQESLFFAWVKNSTELDRVTRQRAKKAKREDMNLSLTLFTGAEEPPPVGRWQIGDTVPVKIDRGLTNIDTRFQIAGYMVGVMNGQERVNVVLQEPV